MVENTCDKSDQIEPYYQFWAQFDEDFFDAKVSRSPESLPIDLGPYIEALSLSKVASESEGAVARRWRLAKEISRAAVPRIESACKLANSNNLGEHKCPSQVVCDLIESDVPSDQKVSALAAALLLPRTAEGSFSARGGGVSARLIAAKAETPYYVAYHWLTS